MTFSGFFFPCATTVEALQKSDACVIARRAALLTEAIGATSAPATGAAAAAAAQKENELIKEVVKNAMLHGESRWRLTSVGLEASRDLH
jgi:hypothetical protein